MVRLVHVPARFMVHTVHLGVLWINGRIEIVGLAENIVAHNVARRFFSLLRAASASAAASAASASFALRSSSRSSFFAVNPPNISSMSSFSLEVGRRAAAAAVTLSAPRSFFFCFFPTVCEAALGAGDARWGLRVALKGGTGDGFVALLACSLCACFSRA
eukprot:CAMPEP_0195577798 /NCGR_PEP_ID=MMETSP0814-20130614/10929_1 /TAXON_ID=97485 /ORGANISM="Prymnesium parvum, Strain Texoma1" /LENGTH=159 /DNA_ID=CAMNT_0040714231 /DNA_START=183 /DNA_END=663 /DNA_ORIENTATION=+